jgi:hypothetical protein
LKGFCSNRECGVDEEKAFVAEVEERFLRCASRRVRESERERRNVGSLRSE